MTAPDPPAGPDDVTTSPSAPADTPADSLVTPPVPRATPPDSPTGRPSGLASGPAASPSHGIPDAPARDPECDRSHGRTPVRLDHLADGAIRVELAGESNPATTARVVALARAIRDEDIPGILDVLPAYVTVVVTLDPAVADPDVIATAVVRLADAVAANPDVSAREVTLPVTYGGPDGPDLDDVARHVGLAPAEVIARHAGETYTVACLGFAPGFPFLLGLPADLATPRLTSPRTTTPVGSVAIGGVQTGVYPLATPGGWRIIGRTPVTLFDPLAPDPFLLAPGDHLRFAPVGAGTAAAIAADPDPRRAATIVTDTSPGLPGPSAPSVEPGPAAGPDRGPRATASPDAGIDPAAHDGELGTVTAHDPLAGMATAPISAAGATVGLAGATTPRSDPGQGPGVAVGPRASGRDPRAGLAAGAAAESMGTIVPLTTSSTSPSSFAVLDGGLLTTVQDLGRPGLEHLGVSAGGAVDRTALRLGNLLAGNDPGAAGLEITLTGPRLRLDAGRGTGAVVVVAGADLGATIDGQPLPPWRPAPVSPGGEVAFRPGGGSGGGARAYLCVAGGFDLPAVLGGRATDLTGRFGGLAGRALRAGDALPIGTGHLPPDHLLRHRLAVAPPSLDDPARLAVVLGPQRHRFTDDGVAALLGGTFVASTRADRLGIRLTGPEVTLAAGADMLSEGIAPGAIQVPGDGQPIALLRARQTVGGYPKVATVITAGLDRLAQVRPGDPVTFEVVDRHEARRRALTAHARWRAPIREDRPVQGVGWASGGDAPTVAAAGDAVETSGPRTDEADRRAFMDRPGSPPTPDHGGPGHPDTPVRRDPPDAPAGIGPPSIGAWDPDGVVRVIRAAREAGLRELRLRIGDLEVELRRDDDMSGADGVATTAPVPRSTRSADPHLPADASTAAPASLVVRAPVLGLFYRRPSPAEEPFVAVGQIVTAGQTIGLIEVMKTFHEVTAEAAGTVAAFLVEDGQFVEYGTPLVDIDPVPDARDAGA